MNDCIERKKAIELIQPHVKPQTVYGKGYLQAIEHATDILELMPAADVKLIEHGKWEDCEIRGSLSQCCSICGCDSGVLYPYTYCPNCGARMDLEDGDTNE